MLLPPEVPQAGSRKLLQFLFESIRNWQSNSKSKQPCSASNFTNYH